MNKTGLIALIASGVLALGGGSVYAANQIARSNAIGEEAAKSFAIVDAGVLPEDANVIRVEFDFDHGRFVYEIDFTSDGVKYEYKIDSQSGAVLEKESEKLPTGVRSNTTQKPQTTAGVAQTTGAMQQAAISIEEAKQAALKHAGVDAASVSFAKTKLERENGSQVYDVEFFIAGEKKFDYHVDAMTGAVLEGSVELWEADDYLEYHIPQEQVAEALPQENAADPAAQGTQSAAPAQGPSVNQGSSSAPAANSTKDIGVEKAKSIALSNAGVSAGSAVFSKAYQDWDDGVLVYDIEFYVSGVGEYDYEINAATGAIRSSEVDRYEQKVTTTQQSTPTQPTQQSTPTQTAQPSTPMQATQQSTPTQTTQQSTPTQPTQQSKPTQTTQPSAPQSTPITPTPAVQPSTPQNTPAPAAQQNQGWHDWDDDDDDWDDWDDDDRYDDDRYDRDDDWDGDDDWDD